MRIDVQAHYMPTSWLELLSGRTKSPRFEERDGVIFKITGEGLARPLEARLHDIPAKLAVMDANGIDMANLSLSMFTLEEFEDDEAVALAKDANTSIAAVAREYPDRIIPIGVLPMSVPEACVPEVERCVNELGMRAIQIYNNTGGIDLEARQYWPIYERMVELDVPMIMHPTYPFGLDQRLLQYHLTPQLGFMFDSVTALARMIYSGMLDQFADLKIIVPHLGGGLLWYAGRLDYQVAHVAPQGTFKIKRERPSDYIQQLYFDTIVNYEPAFMLAYNLVGPDRLLFATDYPYWQPTDAVAHIESLPIPDEAKEQIYHQNAVKLLKLDVGARTG